MKIKIIPVFLVFLLFFMACQEDSDNITPSGKVFISSEFFGTSVYYVNGYSFELEKYVPSVNSGEEVADIYGVNILAVNGDVTGIVFSVAPGNPYGFYKNFESMSLTEAENFYNQYQTASMDEYSEFTDTLAAGQVYTFRTHKDNYVKFLVRKLTRKTGTYSDFFEVEITYYINREGSPDFPE